MNSPYLLNSTTVHDDATSDMLTGGTGNDWFLAHANGATGKYALTDKARG